MSKTSPLARLLQTVFAIEPLEIKAVLVSLVYCFFIFFSYFIVRPLRDAMGTVYGVSHYQDLFTGTFLLSLIVSPVFAGLASRIRLATFLPWVYGFIALTMVGFYFALGANENSRVLQAGFFIWTSVFNLLTIAVFWSMMADIFSKTQAKRLFGFVAAGGTAGTILAPLFVTFFVNKVGANTLMLISAAGFVITALLVKVVETEKRKFAAEDAEAQQTSLDKKLGGSPFDGFLLVLKSPYLLMIALFLLLMTWISTVVYFQLGDLISHDFATKAARTQAYATIDLAVNGAAVFIQLFGTSRFIKKFGVTAGLLLNPVIMVAAFLAVAFSPVLMVLGGIQVMRRVAEYSVAKPSRDMLYTVVDQQAKYKAKNVIDVVVYRFGDVTSAWLSSTIVPYGVPGLAIFGIVICACWFPIAWMLGRRYESLQSGEIIKSS